MSSDFIETKTAEALAAHDAGDTQGLVHALAEAIKENDASFEETLAAISDAIRRQRGA